MIQCVKDIKPENFLMQNKEANAEIKASCEDQQGGFAWFCCAVVLCRH